LSFSFLTNISNGPHHSYLLISISSCFLNYHTDMTELGRICSRCLQHFWCIPQYGYIIFEHLMHCVWEATWLDHYCEVKKRLQWNIREEDN